ncbi:SPFH domain-containing protein [Solitalea sp. MAHUQ-68]|uniref:SPFH domain-containing protein n=1 Tax=Solitalea agri TaxID=2953739 RepID=A0A9X2F2U9_9SPHI|nr:SPFH domain-containing protein [Solitalea agri]MCO4293607.1 SPFH domain-containing protein [Solitalea agri]
MNEKIKTPISGFAMLGFAVLCLAGTAFSFIAAIIPLGILLFLVAIISFMGIIIINPNESRVLTFFGTYVGTVKANGLFFVNPLYKKQSVSLRARNLNGQSLKVNDKMGNPIEIAAVIVWQVNDTAKATFSVDNYTQYVNIQSEAAVRHLAGSCPYDNLEDENATLTLRDGADKVNEMLEKELNERLAPAGITVLEARISHLAYAPSHAATSAGHRCGCCP